MEATPTNQQGHLDVFLSPEETAFLCRTKRDPNDYAALVITVTDRGVGLAQTPKGKMVVMNLQVLIPHDFLPLKFSGLVGPDGQHVAGGDLTTQIPGAPLVRMLVAKAALGTTQREALLPPAVDPDAPPERPTLTILPFDVTP